MRKVPEEDRKQIYSMLKNGYYIRTLHYHNTPRSYQDLYRRQISYIADKMQDSNPVPQPALFDGYRNNYDVMFPILENNGVSAWFLLVTDFIDTPASDQHEALNRYQMESLPGEYPDGRYAMNWNEIRKISQTHTLINHSATHYRLNEDSSIPDVIYEIEQSHNRIREQTGISCQTFSWLGGAGMAVHPAADQILLQKGYSQILGNTYDSLKPARILVEECPPASQNADIQEIIAFHQKRTKNRTIFHAVPGLLPCPLEKYRNNSHDNTRLASLFWNLSTHLPGESDSIQKNRINKALEVLAYAAYPSDFPWE